LKEALETPAEDQVKRNRIMRRRLQRYDVNRWAGDFLTALLGMKEIQNRIESKLLSATASRTIVALYQAAHRRLLFLDYDGTLTPLVRSPALATPDGKSIKLLNTLCADSRNSVVITSGRDRRTLEEWFGDISLGLIAEHGAWLKLAGESWQRAKMAVNEWKQELLPTLETYADRLPGSFVEEKEESVAWHYRVADPEQGEVRAAELVDHLLNLTGKADLQVVQGNKVVEIRRAGVSKGNAAAFWMGNRSYDFILAIGDDATDEDLFRSMPASAVSIRVGISGTHAQYNIRSCAEVIDLLSLLAAQN
jgi:trehalose 6-phosphate synthase/phosphatase